MAKCMCVGCNNNGTVKIRTNHKTVGYGYMCERHATSVDGYTYENDNHMNTHKKHGLTFGCEFETNHSSLKARGILLENGFVPTYDCTVNCEYKSSIHHGLGSFSQLFKSFDRLIESGDLSVADSERGTCGTHFHVGHETMINAATMRYLRRFYHSLFVPLCNEMQNNRAATIALFGRYFTDYACTINPHSDATAHNNFINLQHTYSIEFRLCKYRNAKQFTMLTHMLKEFGIAITETYIANYDNADMKYNNKVYINEREYRKALAVATSARLVKIFKKYAAKVANN